jgi:hypothetical protein
MTKKVKNNPSPGYLKIYEINTAVWLNELRGIYGKKITLANIPAKEYDELAGPGFNTVWLMGVWKRSPAGKAIAMEHPVIMKELKEALPDLKAEDIEGSPYCIREYVVDPQFGGDKGLAVAREELARRGMKLILDFVPNHIAPDHPWTKTHPGYFLQGTEDDMIARPDHWYRSGNHIYAKARDPFYPPWPDVLQLNVFDEGCRDALIKTLNSIASVCDGIRCDMAMLIMNDIFSRTWADRPGAAPHSDFWPHAIAKVKKHYPGFIFIAEAYWDTEKEMISQGFDFCYDKKYYDFLKEGAFKSKQHLENMMPVQGNLLRFLENHDEPRAAGLFEIKRHKALALASTTLPGAKLLHDGQLEGRKVKVPVFLSRRMEEPENRELKKFYIQLLKIQRSEAVNNGKWFTCAVSGWPDNQTCQNLLVWEWLGSQENLLIVINMSDQPAQALVKSNFFYAPGKTYQLFDVISGELFARDSDEMNSPGLFVGLQPWGAHTFLIEY